MRQVRQVWLLVLVMCTLFQRVRGSDSTSCKPQYTLTSTTENEKAEGAVVLGKMQYLKMPEPMTWHDAQNACNELELDRSQLVVIKSREVEQLVATMTRTNNTGEQPPSTSNICCRVGATCPAGWNFTGIRHGAGCLVCASSSNYASNSTAEYPECEPSGASPPTPSTAAPVWMGCSTVESGIYEGVKPFVATETELWGNGTSAMCPQLDPTDEHAT
jgi:hypothetical protein